MPEICTCGAQLPPDAIFCHKCGKPQRDVAPVEPEPHAAEPPPFRPVAPPQAPPLTFHNPVALRIAVVVGLVATCLFFLPYLNWLAAGYFAVFFYRRRTGQVLSIGLGLKMGWITGLVMFALAAAMTAGFAILLNTPGAMEVFQAQLKTVADAKTQEAARGIIQVLQSRTDFAAFLLDLFVFITGLSMAGGALGAKLVGHGP
jgi:hypothetical protein